MLERYRLVTATVVIALISMPMRATGEEGLRSPAPEYAKAAISAQFPYESKYVHVLGARMHYVDEGQGDTFLFLHGNPTSSYLWRNVLRYVKPHGRAIAVDNIGFGKSDKPQVDYTLQTHGRYIKGFIDALELENVTLVVHDWGSVLGLNYAVEHSDNVKGVVFMEAIVPPAFPMQNIDEFGPAADLFRRFRDPVAGKQALIEENLFVDLLLANATVTRKMTDAEMAVYRAPFETAASRLPIYRWPNELPVAGKPRRNVDVINRIGQWLHTSDTPKLLQYASPGVFIPPSAAEWAAEHYKNLETQFVGYGRHFIQEDNPEAIGRGIVDWHRRLSRNENDESIPNRCVRSGAI